VCFSVLSAGLINLMILVGIGTCIYGWWTSGRSDRKIFLALGLGLACILACFGAFEIIVSMGDKVNAIPTTCIIPLIVCAFLAAFVWFCTALDLWNDARSDDFEMLYDRGDFTGVRHLFGDGMAAPPVTPDATGAIPGNVVLRTPSVS
jgi:hypothetical protein